MKWLRREGLIAPEEIAAHVDSVPLDFTRLNGRELGAVHSRYAVRHAHALFVLAKLASEVASLTYDLKHMEAIFRTLHKKDFKTKWELDDALMDDEEVEDFRDKLKLAEIQMEIVDGLVKGYDGLARAASREISRRTAEQAPRD